MALDGAFLRCLRRELDETLQQARVDKVHQPGKEELILSLRWRGGTEKLYLSATAEAPRIHFTRCVPENPPQPPMFCMLLRKRLTGGKLVAIRQDGLERILNLDFDCINELGDPVRLTLAVEIMGRRSNIILVGEDGRVIDAIKRVDPAMSPVRPVLPGLTYTLPPMEAERVDLSLAPAEQLVAAVRAEGELPLSKALQRTSQGLSPMTCRELSFRVCGEADLLSSQLTEVGWARLEKELVRVQQAVTEGVGQTPYLVQRPDGTPLEFGFFPITQYGLEGRGHPVDSFSELLDLFYARRAAAERMRVRSRDLRRVLTATRERIERKLVLQRQELSASADRELWRLYGDLIHANMGRISPGADAAELVDYYDENCALRTVPLDPSLSAAANAQKYYKEYRKAQTAERVLTERIAAGEQERLYIETVADALSRAESERELEELRQELEEEGYLRRARGRQKPPLPTKPLSFRSSDGFLILVGRNNRQNDRLTLHTARGSDLWLHTKNIPGSHVIVCAEGQPIPDRTVEQAAVLAATYSKAADSHQVPVEYTFARFVKKPSGAKPGMVIYTDNRTAFVDPNPVLCQQLSED